MTDVFTAATAHAATPPGGTPHAATPPGSGLHDEALIEQCVGQVRNWLDDSARYEKDLSRPARRRGKRIGVVVNDAATAEVMMALTDEVLRVKNPKAAAERFRDAVGGHPTALPFVDRALLRLGAAAAPHLPKLVMPLVVSRLRRETSATIIGAGRSELDRHQQRRRSEGFTLNINRLGEAILGRDEALTRRHAVIEMIRRTSTSHVSIKLSAIAANISALDYGPTVERLAEALRPVYHEAMVNNVFVNLDMEEYRDLALTIDVFRTVLDEPEFQPLTAGIVLQAYLPDTHAAVESLGTWARQRVEAGGSPIRIRLVKGANLAMENVDAEIHGWAPATYGSKLDVDASWKRLLDTLLEERFDGAITVGAASHNLFDVAWALAKRKELAVRGCPNRLRFEMLEGMAEAQARAVRQSTGDLLMYTPVVDRTDFVPAIGYLTRRLDENTGPENFLRALTDLKPHSRTFDDQVRRFAASVRHRHDVSTDSRRLERPAGSAGPAGPLPIDAFTNEADTDITQTAGRETLLSAVAGYRPAVAAGIITTTSGVDEVVAAAVSGAGVWGRSTHHERAELLRSVARRVSEQRSETVALLAHESNKTVPEGDSEVSEAVDFANYYARSAERLAGHDAGSSPLGTVVVTPPWNFPYAITMGGVLAALAAGNAVILKPTPQCPLVAQKVARDCWDAGIPHHALHLLPVPDDHVGRHLVTHEHVDAVILTGSIQTARMFLGWKPSMRLLAETSGKNALVIMASADIDLAIKDLVKSAFGHAGQKCSAASLAIVEASVYDSPDFHRRLADAVNTLRCGAATDAGTDVAPLMEAPSPALLRALTTLEPGEAWLVRPRQYDSSDPTCWTPGVRTGVAPGSWFHLNECFGPVLGLLRAENLDHAMALQNSTPFGLTAGLHTLDRHEVAQWVERVEAGNVYVNRTITGAIVQRQPFGGWKASSVGPTAKAGGPSYVNVLRRWPAGTVPDRLAPLRSIAASEIDASGLGCETNTLRYRPLPAGVLVWVGEGTPISQRELAAAAALATGTGVTFLEAATCRVDDAIRTLQQRVPDRLRILGTADDTLRAAAHSLGVRVDDDPMSDDPRVEVVRWMREQSVSVTQHRHGRPHRLPFR